MYSATDLPSPLFQVLDYNDPEQFELAKQLRDCEVPFKIKGEEIKSWNWFVYVFFMRNTREEVCHPSNNAM